MNLPESTPLADPASFWPPASPLLREVIEAQGSLDRWRSAVRLDVHLRVRPNLFAGRFLSPRLRRMTAQIDTRQVRAVLTPFPSEGFRGVFEGDEVRIESESGEVLSRLSNARADACQRTVWSDLHALYFFGYAFWNYTQTPFLFLQPGFELTELPPVTIGGERQRRLGVRYPPGMPTHCREQTFYFDDCGLLRRLDYTAEIFGSWVRGAHLVEKHQTFCGLVYPTHRFVQARLQSGLALPGPRAIEGWIDGIDVIDDRAADQRK